MKCLKCGFENRPDARFCKQCGQPLQAKPPTGTTCPACGAANDSDARFCRACGKPLAAAPAAAAAPTEAEPTLPTSVQIEGSVSGQVAIGNNILQIGDVHGGVVNVMMPKQKVLPKPRPTPVDLRPRAFPNLLDRETEINTATAALQSAQPVEFQGQAGFGKTSLLRHLAHHPAAASFPDGVVYLSARSQPADDLLQSLYDAFYQADAPYKPTDAQLKHDLRNKRALVLLDDVALEREDVEKLMDAAPACAFLLGSPERRLLGEGKSIALGGLPPDAAIALIERELGRQLTKQERPVAQRLRLDAKGNPLALIQIAAETREKGKLLTDLKAQEDQGGMHTTDLLDFPRQHMQLIRYITRQGKATVKAAADHLGESTAATQQILDTMVENGHLERVEEKGEWVYKMHFARKSARGLPPGIWHAVEQGAEDSESALFTDALNGLPAQERQIMAALAAMGRVPVHAEHLTAITGLPDATSTLQALQRRGLAQAHSPRYSLTGTLDQALQQAWDLTPWMERALAHFTSWAEENHQAPDRLLEDADAVLHVLKWAVGASRWADVLRLGHAVEGALTLGGRWAAWMQTLDWMLQAGRALGDQAAEAWALHQVGTRALCLEDSAAARAALTKALELRQALGDGAGAAITQHNLDLLSLAPPPPPKKPPKTRPPLPKWLLPTVGIVAVAGIVAAGATLVFSGVIPTPMPSVTEEPAEATKAPTRIPTKVPTKIPTRAPTVVPTESPWIDIDLEDGCDRKYREGDETRITVESNVGGPVKVWLDERSIGGLELEPGGTWARDWIFADMSLGEHEFRATLISSEGSVLDESTCSFTLLQACIDFDDLELGEYDTEQEFFYAGVKITVIEGSVIIGDEEVAGGSGQELGTDSGIVAFEFDPPLDGLTLRYSQRTFETPYTFLEINGKQWGSDRLDDADGITLGGVKVTVYDSVLKLDGTINSFMIGGSDLFIDDVCPE